VNFGETAKTTEGMTLIAAVDPGSARTRLLCARPPQSRPEIEQHRAIAHVSCIRLIPKRLRAFTAPSASNLGASQYLEMRKPVNASAGMF